jgi:hypothetical protein
MEFTDKDKIEALERILTAILGRQEAKVEYKNDFDEQTRVIVKDCDPDDVMKIRGNLLTADIEFDFYITVQKCEPTELFPEPYEGVCEVTFYVEDQYWKIVQEQKKTIANLNKQLETLSPNTSTSQTMNISSSNYDSGISFTASN